MNIYVTGLIAYETAAKLYEEHKAELTARFPAFFLREFENLTEGAPSEQAFLGNLCIEKNTQKNYSNEKYYYDGEIYVREIKEGGIFGALWAACEDLKVLIAEAKHAEAESEEWVLTKNLKTAAVGCEIRLEDIPIDQHVVEVLEYLKESPYEVSSAGSYLVICEESFDSEEPFTTEHANVSRENSEAENGSVPKRTLSSKIGETTDTKDRVIIYGESRRFLTPPKRQQSDIADRKNH